MHSWLWHGAALTYTDLTILQWWGKNAVFYPRWSILAKKYLAIPALYMYVPSERVFSLAGHLVNKKRARLSPSNIGNIISRIKTWNTTGNNTDNCTLEESGWQCSVFCVSVQSNLFMFDVVCHLLNFVHCLWICNLMW
jgi:hypothetical protein